MNYNTLIRGVLLPLLALAVGTQSLSAQYLFQETFDNQTGGNASELTVGWHSYQGGAATDISSEISLSFLSNLSGNPSAAQGSAFGRRPGGLEALGFAQQRSDDVAVVDTRPLISRRGAGGTLPQTLAGRGQLPRPEDHP
ncbi:MAG: hypothetical protein WC205_18325 [Opitutaceae bacterium]|jgi:hypothetical protein